MRQLKYAFIAAMVFALPFKANANDGGYITGSLSYMSLEDATASYRGTEEAYGLDDDMGYSAAFGYGFMKNFAIEMKLNYTEGSVDTIGGEATKAGSSYNYGAATLGVIYKIDEIELDKSQPFALTPYLGLAGGYDAGYLDAQKDSEVNCGGAGGAGAGCASGDNRFDHGVAGRISIGALLTLHDNLGLDVSYDYLAGSIDDNHFANAGIRIMF